MAITLVGAEAAAVTGEHPTVNSISVPYPAGLNAGDALHMLIVMPLYRWYSAQYLTMTLARQYGISMPVGWQLVASDAYNAHVGHESTASWQQIAFLLRRIAVGNETGDVVVPITRTNLRPDLAVPDEAVFAGASIVAHSGVNLGDVYDQPPIFRSPYFGGRPVGNVTSGNSHLVHMAATYGRGSGIDPDTPMDAWPDPVLTEHEYPPEEWDVHAQESTTTGLARIRAGALDTDNFTPGAFYPGDFPMIDGAVRTGLSLVLFALRDAGDGPATDAPPAPGQVGVTGSGNVTPEWDGRDHVITNPLLCSVWGEALDGEGNSILGELLDVESAPRPVAADLTFNGLGACTSGTVAFPAHPGFVPYVHALKLHLTTSTDEGTPAWWAGVVKNVRYDNGLYQVDVDGLWSLLNDARVTVDNDEVQVPDHPVITDTLTLGIGDPATLLVDAVGAQQSWGSHLNDRFRITPGAAWGIGPDQVFVMGQPEQGGVVQLDADADAAVILVEAGEFIHPPFVTAWWAQDDSGNVLTAETYPPPGLLSPARLKQSQVDDLGNLMTPKEADYPLISGPSHRLEVAGIAVPPLQVTNLPNGEAQMVASARVVINVGEEGSMPRVTTTLTTVALPYERGG